jgi:hypothetical protein
VQYAIEELKMAIIVAETNEPINRAEGNVAQADLEKETADSCRKALAVLMNVPSETTFKERVVAEKRELDGRLEKLDAFIGTDKYRSLHDVEKERLCRQAGLMRDYSGVLGERIAAFG